MNSALAIEAAIRGLDLCASVKRNVPLAESKLFDQDCLSWLGEVFNSELANNIERQFVIAEWIIENQPRKLESYFAGVGDTPCTNYVEAAIAIGGAAVRVIDAAISWIQDETSIEDWESCPRKGLRMAMIELDSAPIAEVQAGLGREWEKLQKSREYSTEQLEHAAKLSLLMKHSWGEIAIAIKICSPDATKAEQVKVGSALKRAVERSGLKHKSIPRGRRRKIK